MVTSIVVLPVIAAANAGPAAADADVVGKRYSEAKSVISEAGQTPVVAVVIGDKLPHDQCYVVGTAAVAGEDEENLVRVNLNCYPKPATGVNPGFSAGNTGPEAAAVRATSRAEELEWKQSDDGQKWCAQAVLEHPDWAPIEGC